MRRIDQKIVIVTRPTQLAALRQKFNTRSQAKFQIVSAIKRKLAREVQWSSVNLDEMAEQAFVDVDQAATKYDDSVQQLRGDLDFDDFDLPIQTVDRDFLPNFVFGPHDVVITVDQDGHAVGLPIVAVNPDPQRIDGVLLPFRTDQVRDAVRAVLQEMGKYFYFFRRGGCAPEWSAHPRLLNHTPPPPPPWAASSIADAPTNTVPDRRGPRAPAPWYTAA